MGLRHLELIEGYLKKQSAPVSKTQIRDELKIDYNMVLDVLSYLLKNKRVRKIKGKYERRNEDGNRDKQD